MTRVGRIGALAWLIAAAVILLWPVPVDRGSDHWLLGVLRELHAHGLPRWIGYGTVEFSANVLLFAPLGVFLVLALVRRIGVWSIAFTVAAGVALSLAAELAQEALLPERFATASDVAANVLGTVLAAAVAWTAFWGYVRVRNARIRVHALG